MNKSLTMQNLNARKLASRTYAKELLAKRKVGENLSLKMKEVFDLTTKYRIQMIYLTGSSSIRTQEEINRSIKRLEDILNQLEELIS